MTAHLHLPSLEAQSTSAPAGLQSPPSTADPHAPQVGSEQRCEQQTQSKWTVKWKLFLGSKCVMETGWPSSTLLLMKIRAACHWPAECLQLDEFQKYVAIFLRSILRCAHGMEVRNIWTCSEKPSARDRNNRNNFSHPPTFLLSPSCWHQLAAIVFFRQQTCSDNVEANHLLISQILHHNHNTHQTISPCN